MCFLLPDKEDYGKERKQKVQEQRVFHAAKGEEVCIQVFNALNGTDYDESEKMEIDVLENAVYLSFRNDASFIIAMMLNIYEHQSTFNPNMPLRDLIYVSDLLANIVKEANLFGSRLVKIPTPRFVTFYNGEKESPDREVLKLSDAFMTSVNHPELELECTVININEGRSKEFMEKCPVLREYSIFVGKVRRYRKVMSLKEAIDKAIDECIEEHILEDFLKTQRAEVASMSVLEFNLEKQLKFAREDGREEGWEAGRNEGWEAGKSAGSDFRLITMICRKLKKGKTPDVIAEELEEEKDMITEICKVAEKFAPEYDVEKIYETLQMHVA